MTGSKNVQAVEVCFPSNDLPADIGFFTGKLGFRLNTIFPADDPAVAVLSGQGTLIRLERATTTATGLLRLVCLRPDEVAGGERELIAPNGVRIQIVDAQTPLETPRAQHALVVSRMKDGHPWVVGRAGMLYRDLIPGRLGGAIIASHIRIPEGGPVADSVHYHTVGFQLIFCHRGWVRLVYEDQGPPFVLKAGDCVIQPPQIRHRVLVASENLHVVEVGVPAEHITTLDHEMELPTPHFRPDRSFGGQTFCRSELEDAVWTPARLSGFEARDTGVSAATAGVASVHVLRPTEGGRCGPTSHDSDILFAFVLSGSLTLSGEAQTSALNEGDAYMTPPGMITALTNVSSDLRLLEVSLPADFATKTHPE